MSAINEFIEGWGKLVVFFLPIAASGFVYIKFLTRFKRFESILGLGVVVGVVFYTFLVNLCSFVIPPRLSITVSFVIEILIALVIVYKDKDKKVVLTIDKYFLVWVLSMLWWGTIIFWKAGNAILGGDTDIYYSIASTFIKGNFPVVVPWQPSIYLSYHVGISELLGAFNYLTGYSFGFLHRFFSFIFIFSGASIIFSLLKRRSLLVTLLFTNMSIFVVLLSAGFIKIVIPMFPFVLPKFNSFSSLVLWVRNLPIPERTIDSYAAPLNIDSMVYVLFYPAGFVVLIASIVLFTYSRKEKIKEVFISFLCLLCALSIINEIFLVISIPVLVIFLAILKFKYKVNGKFLIVALLIFIFVIIFQGGVISNYFVRDSLVRNKISLLSGDMGYITSQQVSKFLPSMKEWMPFWWYHLGPLSVLALSFVLFGFLNSNYKKRLVFWILISTSLAALFSYNFISPTYIPANGNRFLVAAFQLSGLLFCYLFVNIFDKVCRSKNIFVKLIPIILLLFVLLPSIAPPFAYLTKTRFGKNVLTVPYKEVRDEMNTWIWNNIPVNNKVLSLDGRSPHTSLLVNLMTKGGVEVPLFPGEYRAYTLEPSPEYVDVVYSLSSAAIRKLRVDYLLVDSDFVFLKKFENLLHNNLYFASVHSVVTADGKTETLYKVKDGYSKLDRNSGTLSELNEKAPKTGKFYIDGEQNFSLNYLRRPLIFSLRDRDLYYSHDSGVYLNVEEYVPEKFPEPYLKFDYLVLAKKTSVQSVCKCKAELIWKGLNGEVLLWHVIKS